MPGRATEEKTDFFNEMYQHWLTTERNAFAMLSACTDALPKWMMKYIPALTEKEAYLLFNFPVLGIQ